MNALPIPVARSADRRGTGGGERAAADRRGVLGPGGAGDSLAQQRARVLRQFGAGGCAGVAAPGSV